MLTPLFSIKFDHTTIYGQGVYGESSQRIFVLSSNGTLFAYNTKTMKSEWSYLLDCPKIIKCEFKSTPLVIRVGESHEFVIIGGFYAFDAYTGKLKWKRDDLSDTINNTPIADKNVIYVGTRLSYLLALDILTGNTKYKKLLDGGKVTSPATIKDNVLLVGTKIALQRQGPIENVDITDGFLFALNATNGKEIWRFKPAYRNSFLFTPCIHNDKVITSTFQPTPGIVNYVYALSFKNGKLLWKHIIDDFQLLSSPVSSPKQDLVFVPVNNGMLITLDGSSGTAQWIYNTKSGIDTTPMIQITVDNTAIIFGDVIGNIHSLSCIRRGDYSYEVYKAYFRTISTPNIVSDYLLITGSNGRLNIYNYSTNCENMQYVDFVPTSLPTLLPTLSSNSYSENYKASSLFNAKDKFNFLIYLLILLSIIIVLVRYLIKRYYYTYQDKKKTRLNISSSKKNKDISIMSRIRSLFQSSSSSSIAYKLVGHDNNNDDDDAMSNTNHLGQYYDVSHSNTGGVLQRKGITVNPLHANHDIDTTDVRMHTPLILSP